jgi:hypothetical protein
MRYFIIRSLIVYIPFSVVLVACSGIKNLVSPATGSVNSSDSVRVETAISGEDPLIEERMNMVDADVEARGISNPDVLQAMRSVPRDKFVPDDLINLAYSDRPLPIGYGQTISQPYIVGWMTELLDS